MSVSWWRRLVRQMVATPAARRRGTRRAAPRFETLEARDVPAVFAPDYLLNHGGVMTPFGSPGPSGYTPAQMAQAYGINQLSYTGAGTTIAIVDAYNDPTVVSDLQAFSAQFGLPAASITVVNQNGGTTLPASDPGWAGEIALDVEWAHAIAPGAKILLVEANSAYDSDLFTAVRYAASQPGVVAVSMSWGGGEFSGESSYDSYLTTPAGHSGVVFTVSSGDSGAPAQYPSASPNVLSVGGTSLYLSNSNYSSESAWSGSGGGISAYESQPSYQQGVVTQSTTRRATPDVAYDADPNTGVPVYQTYGNSGGPWLQYGGTSAAAPQWAALVALADQGRAANSLPALSNATLMPLLYSLRGTDFHDVTTGSSSGSPSMPAGVGYDLATGIGTPIANKLIPDLVGGSSSSPTATHFSVTSTTTSLTAGGSMTVTVTALDASGNTVPGYTGTVRFTSSDPQAVLPANATLTNGVGTFTVTLKTAGSDSVTATDTANSAVTGTDSGITVTPAAASKLAFLQQPTNTTVGTAISPAVKVEELDAYGNVATTAGSVSLAFGSNPGGATLTGGGAVSFSNGIATFSGLSVSAAGNGYTLVARSGSLTGATSAGFNVTTSGTGGGGGGTGSTGTLVEGFENGLGNYYYTGYSYPFVSTSTAAAHDGTRGLSVGGDGNWYFRMDSAAKVNPGDTLTTWVKFSGTANGQANVGFGTTLNGTMSVVLNPATGQFSIQRNSGFTGATNLASASQTYSANQWYQVEVDWGTSGKVIAKLFNSTGTLLNTVTATTGYTTAGWFAFRATGSTKYFDTVMVTRGVNNFAAPVSGPPDGGSAAGGQKGHGPVTPVSLAQYLAPTDTTGTGTTRHRHHLPGDVNGEMFGFGDDAAF